MHHESYTLHTLLHTLQASHTEHAQKREKNSLHIRNVHRTHDIYYRPNKHDIQNAEYR